MFQSLGVIGYKLDKTLMGAVDQENLSHCPEMDRSSPYLIYSPNLTDSRVMLQCLN